MSCGRPPDWAVRLIRGPLLACQTFGGNYQAQAVNTAVMHMEEVMITYVGAWLRARRVGTHGASLVEYSLLVVLIAVVAIAAVRYFGSELVHPYEAIGTALQGGAATP